MDLCVSKNNIGNLNQDNFCASYFVKLTLRSEDCVSFLEIDIDIDI